MAYNLSLNITSIPDLFSAANILVGNDVVPAFTIITVFVITLLSTGSKTESFEETLLFSSWITAIAAVFIVLLTKSSAVLFILPMVLLLVSLMLYKRK